MTQHERRNEKLEVLNIIYSILSKRLQTEKKIRVNEMWETVDNKIIWSSRAYFLQDLKKYCPSYLKITMSQRSGTFANKYKFSK